MSGSLTCPSCGKVNDDATSLTPEEAFEPPAGAVSICFYCCALGIFTGDGLNTRPSTDEERRQLEADPQVRQAVALIKRYHRGRGARWN